MTPTQRLELEQATSNYLEAVRRGANGGKLKHGSTFVQDGWRDWVNPDSETEDVAINGCSGPNDKRRKVEEYFAKFRKETA